VGTHSPEDEMREETSRSMDPRSLDLAVGGQAVIEGVMMRCPSSIATAVRTPNGRIVVRRKPYRSFLARLRMHRVPLVRGGLNLIESLALGMGSLLFSAEQALEDETIEEGKQTAKDKLMLGATLVVAFGLSLFLFFYLPLILADLTGAKGGVLFNVVDGILRLSVFLGYLLLIGRMKDMQRLFQYHGAEHKSIHVFEHGLPLIPQNSKQFTTLHPRCGTSFLMFVMLISIAVFMFLGRPETIGDRFQRLAFVPLIGGIAYEFIKLSGKKATEKWMRPFIWPGLMLQKITTREPTLEQVEVAMAALRAVLEAEAAEAAERAYLQLSQAPAA
jgi:uncharacterized protein YqhQ